MKDPWGLQRRSIEVSGKIKRSEFGLTWNQALEMGGVLVSDEVKLTVSAQAVAAQPAETAAA
jgi:polyisoprenoid-binding protein YceI